MTCADNRQVWTRALTKDMNAYYDLSNKMFRRHPPVGGKRRLEHISEANETSESDRNRNKPTLNDDNMMMEVD